ncbi:putative deoxyribonuclease TATDN3 [Schistosoma japonicum]|uniref:Putative deoxyribonuclease TATDN3 n=1 Tax=Schistosoma japonicum TaxID=6182 RepID=A0A4Z2D6F8_SCHJA|nr:deoxyribonuclease TATDN3 [Schistosoma japonicum]TNN12077.1 putative deoxyribonuclease TATDN3 [Schistosoma japonicum]
MIASHPRQAVIDTHCHLCESIFDKEIDNVINRAITANVSGGIVLAEERNDFLKAIDLKKRYPDWVNICLGVHPVQKQEGVHGGQRSVTMKDLKHTRDIILQYKHEIVGIGEIGLDFTPTICPTTEMQDIQKSIFTIQIQLAKQLNLPVNVHSHSAGKETMDILKSEGITKVQMHAFDGRPSLAMIGLSEGYYFSIPSSLSRSKQKQELVKALPLDHILVETDSPVFNSSSTQSHTEPNEAIKVCQQIAEIKGIDFETVCYITTENAFKLYGSLNVKC